MSIILSQLLETLMFEDNSKSGVNVIRPKPSNADMDETEDDKTPRPQGSHLSEDEEPYVTPFPLEKKTRKVVVPSSNDTEAEDSEIERKLLIEKVKKAAVKNSKVR